MPRPTPNVDARIGDLQLTRPPVWGVVEVYSEELRQGFVKTDDGRRLVFSIHQFFPSQARHPSNLEQVQVYFDSQDGVSTVVPKTKPSPVRAATTWLKKLLSDNLFGVHVGQMTTAPYTPTSSWFVRLTRKDRKAILAVMHEARRSLHQADREVFDELLRHLEDDHHRPQNT